MGYAICFDECCGCHKFFGFNPHRVPSIRVNGNREPVCGDCVTKANKLRKDKGIPLFPEPHPEAYEPIAEAEL
jgi:hypothetical protein